MNYSKSIALVGLVIGGIGLNPIATLPGKAQPVVPTSEVQASEPRPDEADRLSAQGLKHYDNNQYAVALESWQQSLVLYREVKDRRREGETLRNMGRAYYMLKDNPKATECFEQSLAIAREVNDQRSEGRALGDLGLVHDMQKQRDQALKYYNKSLAIAREVNDKFGEAITSEHLGQFHSGTDFTKAYTPFQNSLKIWRELRDRRREADILLSIGNFYARWWGNCSRAIEEAYKPSLPIFHELGDRASEAKALGGIGHCYAEGLKHPEAIKYLNQSLVITRNVKNQWYEGVVLTRLGKSHQALDELDNSRIVRGFLSTKFDQPPIKIVNATQARWYAQEGLKIARSVKNRWGEALALETLGRTHVVLGEYRTAIEHQNARLIITRELKYRSDEAATLRDLATAYEGLKDYRQAIALHQAARAIERDYSLTVPPFRMREALIHLGDTYHNSGDDQQAVLAYHEAQDPKESSDNQFDFVVNSRLGLSLTKLGRFQEAETYLRFAIEGEDSFRQSVSDHKSATDTKRIILAAMLDNSYHLLQQVLVAQNRINDALEVAERSRARVFAELLATRISGQPLLKNQALSAPPNLAAIRQIAKDQKATLVQYSLVGPDALYIWVIKPTGELTFRSTKLDPAQPIGHLISDSRAEMGVRSSIEVVLVKPSTSEPSGSNQQSLAKLHEILIAPIAQDLPTDPNQRVIFLPQGELFFVPFAALPDARGKYLIEHHTISIAPSIQALAFTHTQSKQARFTERSIVVGDPTMPIYEGTQLPPLPGARQEAIAIAKILNTSPLLGEHATKSAVLAQIQSASVIHFATHGLLDTVKGEIPGVIALAPSGQDNGLLSASELFDLKLTAHLVVLSACDTGRGDITGDGVVGLSRSLIAAGVPSVVVSLWAVNDKSTSLLMSDFYRNLNTNSSKAQAIRQAMLTTMKTYPNPRDWAAFTLVGESDR